jgi:hypothetical protein
VSIGKMTYVGALVVLLVLTAAAPPALAQRLACAAIRPGETAAAVAKRVTGDARNRFEPWFQIVDPAKSTFVRKAQYDHVRPGWRACVVNEPAQTNARRGLVGAPVAVGIQQAFDRLGRALGALDSTLVLWAALIILIALASSGANEYAGDRQRMVDAMRRFGETFIREFERPLIQQDDPERPIQSRLRARAHRRQLDILLAPNGVKRYPNLSDHRKNVEYDVTRVLQRLRDQPFVCGPIYAQGHWVVIPFHFQVSSKQAGAK